MKESIIIYASFDKQQYYFGENYQDIPKDIQKEIITEVVNLSEKTKTNIALEFDNKGFIFVKEFNKEDVFSDDIGNALDIKQFASKNQELLAALQRWYMIYKTDEGKIVAKIAWLTQQGQDKDTILKKIEEQFGQTGLDFAKVLL
ncbi:hypothetical protein AN639_11625 [Candidatus Epulonipiscium fishelsonii]|uniref:Uncharacterized protein n=1 Tax=Candidatus Epulonipiscium fishelsonii TaxID=77094 RepID=A0ACC8XGD1_9FIRM|nr:hypothetical protein AN396_01730 [Epulopiscium sp. SCG-B11WGA-EpuloA1]ONI42960.1 hypothetical protein AN639_11625 [Epulopiscium sp. SCG-B05WGA-EpuloA1]